MFGRTYSITSKTSGKAKTTLSGCFEQAATSFSIPVTIYPFFTTTILGNAPTKMKTGALPSPALIT
jgi:hypothetical protein